MDRLRGWQGRSGTKYQSRTRKPVRGSYNCMAFEQIVTLTWTCGGVQCTDTGNQTMNQEVPHLSVLKSPCKAILTRYVLHQPINVLLFQLAKTLKKIYFPNTAKATILTSGSHPPTPSLHLLTAIIWFISSSHGAVLTGTICINNLSAPSSVPPRHPRFTSARLYISDNC